MIFNLLTIMITARRQLMTRLYEKKYNKAQWKYVDIDEIEHYLINKYDHTSYLT